MKEARPVQINTETCQLGWYTGNYIQWILQMNEVNYVMMQYKLHRRTAGMWCCFASLERWRDDSGWRDPPYDCEFCSRNIWTCRHSQLVDQINTEQVIDLLTQSSVKLCSKKLHLNISRHTLDVVAHSESKNRLRSVDLAVSDTLSCDEYIVRARYETN